jgi:hypothetical protein
MRTLFIVFLGLIGAGLLLYLLSRFREVWRDRRSGGRDKPVPDHLDRPVHFGHDGEPRGPADRPSGGRARIAPKSDS